MRTLPIQISTSKIYKTVEKIFNDEVTKEDYFLHTFLLWANIFLSGVAVSELFLHSSETFSHYAHIIEIVFGIIFLIEFIFRLIFTYFKNSVYFRWTLVLQLVIIISLIAPHLFGNLAILRLIRSLKILKIFILHKETQKLSGKKIYKNTIFKKIHNVNHYIVKKFLK